MRRPYFEQFRSAELAGEKDLLRSRPEGRDTRRRNHGRSGPSDAGNSGKSIRVADAEAVYTTVSQRRVYEVARVSCIANRTDVGRSRREPGGAGRRGAEEPRTRQQSAGAEEAAPQIVAAILGIPNSRFGAQIRTDQDRSAQIRTDQDRSAQISTDQHRSAQISTDQWTDQNGSAWDDSMGRSLS
jgi:hypothetical protein